MKKGIIIAILIAGGIIALGVCAFAIGNNKSDSKSNVSAGTQPVSSTTLTNKSSNVSSETKSPVNVTNNTNSEKDNNITNNNATTNNNSASVNNNKTSENNSSVSVTNNTDNSQAKSPIVYGDGIPGTHDISHNIIEIHGQVLPQKATTGFQYMLKETNSPITNGKVTISANTPYTEYSGYSNLYKYYIIKPFNLVNGEYKTTRTLNQACPDKTVFNEHENNLTVIGYMQGGIIIAINKNGNLVYVDANSISTNITFERGNVQYFCANATTVKDNIPVRGEPAELPTYNTIGNVITQKGLKVVADAEANGFTRIIFGTANGIFQGWVPSTSIKIENYS